MPLESARHSPSPKSSRGCIRATVATMSLLRIALVLSIALFVASACTEPECSTLSVEDCESASGCAVERTHRQGEDGQLRQVAARPAH